MSGDAFLPLQTPDDLESGVEILFDEEVQQRFFRLPGRGGSSVPPWILTPQHAIPRGTQGVLVRFRCKCDLGYPSGASNQGIGIRLLVITRAGGGTSEDPRIMYDSNPEDTTSDAVWYRETHGDIREVTQIIQMPEEVIGGSHIVVQIYTRGTGGSADIYEGVEIRNHYSRLYRASFGKVRLLSTASEPQFFPKYASGIFAGYDAVIQAREFNEEKASIPKGRPVMVTGEVFVTKALIRAKSTTQFFPFHFGIGAQFKRRGGGDPFWVVQTVSTPPTVSTNEGMEETPLSISRSFVAPEAFTHVQPLFFFYVATGTELLHELDQNGIEIVVTVDDAIEASYG